MLIFESTSSLLYQRFWENKMFEIIKALKRCVAIVKEADERNKIFEKINNQ